MTGCFLGVVRSLEHVQIGKMHQVRLSLIVLEERLEMKKGCRGWEWRGRGPTEARRDSEW